MFRSNWALRTHAKSSTFREEIGKGTLGPHVPTILDQGSGGVRETGADIVHIRSLRGTLFEMHMPFNFFRYKRSLISPLPHMMLLGKAHSCMYRSTPLRQNGRRTSGNGPEIRELQNPGILKTVLLDAVLVLPS